MYVLNMKRNIIEKHNFFFQIAANMFDLETKASQ